MSWLMYSMEWFVVLMTLITTFLSIFAFYRRPEYHNRQTLFTSIALGTLALIALFVAVAQTFSVIRAGSQTYLLFMALFFLMTTITQSRMYNRSLQGYVWRISQILAATLAAVFTLLAIVGGK